MDEVSVILREFNKEKDQALIYSSWRHASYYFAHPAIPEEQSHSFFRKKTTQIREILEKSIVKIATLSDSPDFIVGYSVSENKHLHFIYVKIDYREKRIGTLLFPKDIETVTSLTTKVGALIAEKKNLKFLEGD